MTQNMASLCLGFAQDRLAIIELLDGRRRDITYGALRRRVEDLARDLATRIGRGDRVGVLLGQSADCAAAHLAIWTLGAISVPLFKLFQRDALDRRVGDAGVALVLTDAEGAALLGGLTESWLIAERGVAGPPVPTAPTGPEDPAVLIYTSGTTGSPKGALHAHRVLEGHLPGVRLSHDHLGQAGDCLWTPADWAWIGGLFDVLMPGLALGVPVVAASMRGFEPEACLKIITQASVRNVFFPPTALRMLKATGTKLPGLRSVASGGEPLGAEMRAWGRRALGVEINEFYGQTECNMMVSSCAADGMTRAGAMGQPVPGFTLDVLGAEGEPTKGEGEIAVKRGAPSMMLRYWHKPEETAAKFRGDWMLTGDRGQWEGGFLRFVGREDDVITSSGYRIGPAEIEDCLLVHPAVATVGVVGKPDALRTEIVKAYIVLSSDQSPTEDLAQELQAWVKDRLAKYCYPREIEFVEALPMTVTGKVVRKALKARAAEESV